jgi:hypothetical protein
VFNPTTIATRLTGLVGFRQPFNPLFAKIDATNLLSRSGYFVNDHPYCKVQHLFNSQDYADISDADFNTLLVRKQEESITSVCNAVFNKPDYIDRQVLYAHAQNKQATEPLPSGFLGYRIRVSQEKNIAFKITRVLLDFDSTTPDDIILMLFNTAQSTPIESKAITVNADHLEIELNWVVDNSGTYYKGEYYLGYVTQGITVTPFEREFESSNVESIITHLNIEPIIVPSHSTATLFDLDDVDARSEANGINPDITVYDDFTDLIIQNEHLLSRAVLLSLQIACMSEYAASLRSNRDERKAVGMLNLILAQIAGQDEDGQVKIDGLQPQLTRAITSIKKELEKLHSGYFGDKIMVTTLN